MQKYDDIISFIINNLDVDEKKLIFSKKSDLDEDSRRVALEQLKLRQKINSKLPFLSDVHAFLFPDSIAYEQCSSEFTARYKAKLVGSAAKVLDLTGGIGIDSIFFAKAGNIVDYVEANPLLTDFAKHNFEVLNLQINVINTKAEEYLADCTKKYDAIYADPSRRDESGKKVHSPEKLSPNITLLIERIMQLTDKFILKLSPFTDINFLQEVFARKFKLYVVSHKNECKELLLIFRNDTIKYDKTAVLIDELSDKEYQIEEAKSKAEFSEPSNYLFEPDAAIMKLQAWDWLCNEYELNKLEQNSSLFTSSSEIADLPGNYYKINNIYEYSSKNIKQLKGKLFGTVKTRNFEEKSEALISKMKIKYGKDFIFFVRTQSGKKILICTKLY